MIVARNSQIANGTGHDHDQRPGRFLGSAITPPATRHIHHITECGSNHRRVSAEPVNVSGRRTSDVGGRVVERALDAGPHYSPAPPGWLAVQASSAITPDGLALIAEWDRVNASAESSGYGPRSASRSCDRASGRRFRVRSVVSEHKAKQHSLTS